MFWKARQFELKQIDKFFSRRMFRLLSDKEEIMKALIGIAVKWRQLIQLSYNFLKFFLDVPYELFFINNFRHGMS